MFFFQVLDKKATSARVIPFGHELKTFSFSVAMAEQQESR